MLATLYAISLWRELLELLLPATIMLSMAFAWFLRDHRLARDAYWLSIVAGVVYYVLFVISHGYKAILPIGPSPSVDDPRWTAIFVAKLVVIFIMLASLSTPLWRGWIRRKCGLGSR